jgi:hypothetical protein
MNQSIQAPLQRPMLCSKPQDRQHQDARPNAFFQSSLAVFSGYQVAECKMN